MKKKGSITVFLSLIMILMFSMILTTLEAARIKGGTAYLSMLAELSEDSLLASYYFPLFKEYRLFAVDAGAGTAYFSETYLKDKLEEKVEYGLTNVSGGLFQWENVSVKPEGYSTLLSEAADGFYAQIKEQAALEGISMLAAELFDAQMLRDVALTGEVYEEQEKALEAASTITGELLRLMELVDGISMSDQGLELDGEGRLQAEEYFIKQLLPVSKDELRGQFENEEIYQTIQGKLLHLPDMAEEVKELIEEAEVLEERLEHYDELLAGSKGEERQALRERRDELVEHLDLVWMDAEDQYMIMQQAIEEVSGHLREAASILDVLEEKQEAARLVVSGYERYLEGEKEQLSDELYQVFAEELHTMKLYLGMEEQGYHISVMRRSIATNLRILDKLELSGFSKRRTERMKQEMDRITYGMSGYTTDGLWFTYGEIVAAKTLPGNVWRTLGTLLAGGFLELAGVEDVSKRALSGEELPSEGRQGQHMVSSVKGSLETVKELLLQGEWELFLSELAEGTIDKAALEVYCAKFFGDCTEPREHTRLKYEREYLVFGKKQDAENLLSAVLSVLAIRLLLLIVDTMKNPERMAQLQGFALGLVGFTGIPMLISAVKYGLLFLWALEEAFVETAAMLQGKRLPVLPGEGTIDFADIFCFSGALVRQKAAGIQDMAQGAGYGEYLALFSLLGPVNRQGYLAMDLIQENIRYRYRDGFRIRNSVIEVTGTVTAVLKKKYDTGLFPERAYRIEHRAECSY